jgi:hypothetical protein
MISFEQGKAACGDPQYVSMIDAALEQPGGPQGHLMRRHLCRGCPAREACLDWAMTHDEKGIWGGTSANMRARVKSRSNPSARP